MFSYVLTYIYMLIPGSGNTFMCWKCPFQKQQFGVENMILTKHRCVRIDWLNQPYTYIYIQKQKFIQLYTYACKIPRARSVSGPPRPLPLGPNGAGDAILPWQLAIGNILTQYQIQYTKQCDEPNALNWCMPSCMPALFLRCSLLVASVLVLLKAWRCSSKNESVA